MDASESATPVPPLSPRIAVDRFSTAIDLVEFGFWAPVIDGTLPHVAAAAVQHEVAPTAVLDASFHVRRTATADNALAVLADRPDACVLVRVSAGATLFRVAAASVASAESIASRVRDMFATSDPTGGTEVRVWHHQHHSGAYLGRPRTIETPQWSAIRRNYPPAARSRLDWLHSLVQPTGIGKLILWHGEPGTGKTTAARSLFNAWSPWSAVEYVADAERFFDDPAYIAEVVGRPTSRQGQLSLDRVERSELSWRVIVAEDADEYLRASARRSAGAGLGRLLNLADGVLGQGVNSLILLTTNEPLDRLHPALVRPGRALAQLEFPRFTPIEVSVWLDDSALPSPAAGATLAELFHLRYGENSSGVDAGVEPLIGQYL